MYKSIHAELGFVKHNRSASAGAALKTADTDEEESDEEEHEREREARVRWERTERPPPVPTPPDHNVEKFALFRCLARVYSQLPYSFEKQVCSLCSVRRRRQSLMAAPRTRARAATRTRSCSTCARNGWGWTPSSSVWCTSRAPRRRTTSTKRARTRRGAVSQLLFGDARVAARTATTSRSGTT
jgi:hypothetical protein